MIASILNEYTSAEQELIIRLPFRVGMWVSQVDTAGGGESDTREREALNTVVSSYAEDYLKSEFVQRLMELTLARKNEWSTWTSGIENVPDECLQVMKALELKVSLKEVESFKHNLLDIGIAVAMAYRETSGGVPNGASSIGRLIYNMKNFFSILFGGFKTATADENISRAEHQALVKLAGVMGIKSGILGSAA
jgi:hypothetical protein